MPLVNGNIQARRGVFKAYRDFLNEKFKDDPKWSNHTLGGPNYHQQSRGYGDYLYFQDRVMFDVELDLALQGRGPIVGFDYHKWLA